MSGRVASVDVVVSHPDTIFVGASTGGVWRSEDGGITWTPIFDDQSMLGVGAVAVFQPDPVIVWVGAGEGNPRNSAGVGNGIYKSVDFGATWTHLGLERSERIHRVLTHPSDPGIVYVGAMGPAWSDGEERGVYRTRDGGDTWERVLYVDERTGVADLVMDPRDPNTLFAAMWEFRRWPWFFQSGGPGSGLYVTRDAGDSWTRLTAQDGLPAGDLGRIGVAFARSDPRIVTALIEAERSALVRSYDGGRTWRTLNDEPGIASRPFYYADIRVDPRDANRIYDLSGRLGVSEDEGRTRRTVVPSAKVHGDIHDLWIHPAGVLMINANDGGIAISRNDGQSWRFIENLPVAQFYHIDVDDAVPYNVYGGMQDNGSWLGPSAVWARDGVRNAHWTRIGGGDGFRVLDDPTDEVSGYAMSQGGNLFRFDRARGERKDIRPIPTDPEDTLRFNWNAALAIDPFEPGTIYLGSQYVHRSTNRGDAWHTISPDLTTDDSAKQRQHESGGLTIDATGAENHTTIVTISPSRLEPGMIWVGTDDGNVQLTRDGGVSWTNVGANVPGVPPNTWVPHIEPSTVDSASAFLVFDNHRRGDWTPYVYRTADHGRNWARLPVPDSAGFAHTIAQDLVEPELLFLGTEFGLWISFDAGQTWDRWRHGIPAAPVVSLQIQPREHDLVIGTHGRAAYVLDDIRPLRELARDAALPRLPVHLFEPPHAWLHNQVESPPGYRSTGDAMFAGDNRPVGALLTYSLSTAPAEPPVIEIVDDSARRIREFTGTSAPGVNRTTWDLRHDGVTVAEGGSLPGPAAVPGTYAVRVRVGGAVSETRTLEVRADPRAAVADADRVAKLTASIEALEHGRQGLELLARVRRTAQALTQVTELVDSAGAEPAAELRRTAGVLRERLRVAGDSLDDALGRVRAVYRSLQTSADAPTAAQRTLLERAATALDGARARAEPILSEEVAAFDRRLRRSGIHLLSPSRP
ncbi:MAG: VPS10 domain-containing protein [Longimicrobiales bacterium]